MQFLRDVVGDAVKKHPFQRVSDLTPDEFTELMTDILENALQSQFNRALSYNIPRMSYYFFRYDGQTTAFSQLLSRHLRPEYHIHSI